MEAWERGDVPIDFDERRDSLIRVVGEALYEIFYKTYHASDVVKLERKITEIKNILSDIALLVEIKKATDERIQQDPYYYRALIILANRRIYATSSEHNALWGDVRAIHENHCSSMKSAAYKNNS